MGVLWAFINLCNSKLNMNSAGESEQHGTELTMSLIIYSLNCLGLCS